MPVQSGRERLIEDPLGCFQIALIKNRVTLLNDKVCLLETFRFLFPTYLSLIVSNFFDVYSGFFFGKRKKLKGDPFSSGFSGHSSWRICADLSVHLTILSVPIP